MIIRGEKIRALREERGYTLEDLARRAQLSLSYLSEIERGSKRPSLKTINKLAEALNVSKTRFIEGDPGGQGLSLGEKVRIVRSSKNMSLGELAQKAGISVSYLSEIERGTVNPSLGTLKKLAEALCVPAANLAGREGTLGYRLRTLREEYGLTQAQLASMAGVTAGLIGQIEQGKVQPSLKTLEKIAEVMGVAPCYFITEQDSLDRMVSLLNPQLKEMLMHPNVQAVLGLICNLNEKELQFVLNFIRLFKKSELS